MKTVSIQKTSLHWLLCLMTAGLLASGLLPAQVPVDENGNPIEAIDESVEPALDESSAVDPVADVGEENLTAEELETLVAPVALYPDDLLAIVLPASAYPLQIVQAARFLEQLEDDSSLEPDESWEPSVTALLNYPEVVKLMNEDLDWTYALGEAVVRQQADVIAAVEAFRDRAYAAGNLKSDEHQTVTDEDGTIQIEPVEEKIIYVPYYEPERVVVYQTQPVYHYYSRPCPVYYYPYPYGYSFASGYFWGVTTAFTIGWTSHRLHVFHPSYWGHPYYGRHYYGNYYRRPSISVYNSYYVNNHVRRSPHHARDGDLWRPRRHSGALPGHDRYRANYYRGNQGDARRERTEDGYRNRQDSSHTRQIATGNSRHVGRRAGLRGETGNEARVRTSGDDVATRFSRNRSDTDTSSRNRENPSARRQADTGSSPANDTIRFRTREGAGVTRRAADNDQPIHFRTRERTVERAAPRSIERRTAPNGRDTVTNRSQNRETVAAPSTRQRAVSRGFRSSTHRSATPAPRSASPTHVSRPRAASPAPRMSAPRPAVRHSTSRPAPAARQAPSRAPGAAAPPRRSSSQDTGTGSRRRSHQR